VRMFLYFLQGEHRQIRRSGDLVAEQGVRVMAAEQEVQDMVDSKIPLRNRKSLACPSSSEIA